MAASIYGLCAATSLVCAILLFRGFRETGTRLLFWSAVCFGGLFLNNFLLLIDMRFTPDIDLSMWRTLPALAGVIALLYGLIWEQRA
jgi:hypothetical protein